MTQLPQDCLDAAKAFMKGKMDDPCSIMCPDEMCHYHSMEHWIAELLHQTRLSAVQECVRKLEETVDEKAYTNGEQNTMEPETKRQADCFNAGLYTVLSAAKQVEARMREGKV